MVLNTKNLTLDCGNSGTLSRLILGLLVHSKSRSKLLGIEVYQKEIFKNNRSTKKFGAKFKTNSGKLPIIIEGTNKAVPINIMKIKDQLNAKVV